MAEPKYIKVKNENDLKRVIGEINSKNRFPFVVIIRDVQTIRSINLNAYLWLIYRYISEHTGHTENELHKEFRKMFLPKLEEINSTLIKTEADTKTLCTSLFSAFCESIRMFALIELGINIPLPNEALNDELVFKLMYKYD